MMLSIRDGVCGGELCITGSRITVAEVKALHFDEKQSIDDILLCFPLLTESEVIEAINYKSKDEGV